MTVKPVVQLVFEQLYDAGLREFCYVVGRGKRGIEDHFTPDPHCIKTLEGMGKMIKRLILKVFMENLILPQRYGLTNQTLKGLATP